MRAFGVSLISIGIALAFLLRFVPIEDDVRWIAIIGPPALMVFGAFLLYRGKQYAALAKVQEARPDERAPIIYLRPFAKDESMAGQVFTAFFNYKILSGFATNEEQLAQAVAPIGPLVAIGQPGERLPKPGAIRAYATEAEWKDVVTHWLSIARLVILRPGTTEGVRWEVEQAFTVVRPDRVLLLLMSVNAADYQSISRSVKDGFSIALPPFADVRRWRRVSGFVEFGDDWGARFLPLRAPFWRVTAYKSMLRLFHHSLRPVFDRLGVNWHPMPISYGKIAALSILGLFVLFFGWVVVVSHMTPNYEPSYVRGTTEPSVAVPQPLPDIDWVSWNVVGLQISVPTFLTGFAEPEKLQQRLDQPKGSQKVVEQFEGYVIDTEPLLLTASKAAFKPGLEVSIEGAVRGNVNSMARHPGVANIQSSLERTLVCGHPAIQAHIQLTIEGHNERAESVTFAAGQALWEVQAVLPETGQAEQTLARIINSVTCR
ncbi:MAG: hypothetical protein WBL63_24845 [Candidatus Acidiferrum sp.]